MVSDYEAVLLRALADGIRALAEGRSIEHREIMQEVLDGIGASLPAYKRQILRSMVHGSISFGIRPATLRKCDAVAMPACESVDNA